MNAAGSGWFITRCIPKPGAASARRHKPPGFPGYHTNTPDKQTKLGHSLHCAVPSGKQSCLHALGSTLARHCAPAWQATGCWATLDPLPSCPHNLGEARVAVRGVQRLAPAPMRPGTYLDPKRAKESITPDGSHWPMMTCGRRLGAGSTAFAIMVKAPHGDCTSGRAQTTDIMSPLAHLTVT